MALRLAAGGDFSFLWRPESGQWLLREGKGGQRAIPASPLPFMIGRAWDCHLVLPDSQALARTTSRWHCHLVEKAGRLMVVDGSLKPIPGGTQPKPSISGTSRNGKRLEGAQALSPGDSIAVGPWRLLVEEAAEARVDIDDVLSRLGNLQPLDIRPGDARSSQAFAKLPRLFEQLNESLSVDECLVAILKFAMDKVPGAEVAAILLDDEGGSPTVRLAWGRAEGRLFDFRFSSGLVSKLPPEQAFLLEPAIVDATHSQLDNRITSGLVVPLRGPRSRLGVLYMDNRSRGGAFAEVDLYLAGALASMVSMYLVLEGQDFLARLERNMRQYFGPEVVRLIVEETRRGRPVGAGLKECEASVVVTDLEGFIGSTRGRSAAAVAELLSPYYELVSTRIQSNGGAVVDFLGDRVIGVFGAHPLKGWVVPPASHAAQAVAAAREILTAWTRRRAPEGPAIKVAVHTGRVLAGNLGFSGRMKFSVVGEAIHAALMAEGFSEPDGAVITDPTRRWLDAAFPCEARGEAELKGLGKLSLWRLL